MCCLILFFLSNVYFIWRCISPSLPSYWREYEQQHKGNNLRMALARVAKRLVSIFSSRPPSLSPSFSPSLYPLCHPLFHSPCHPPFHSPSHPSSHHSSHRLLTPPSTSTNCERLFSYAGQVATDRRGSLLPERLHRILFLRENLVMLNFKLEW